MRFVRRVLGRSRQAPHALGGLDPRILQLVALEGDVHQVAVNRVGRLVATLALDGDAVIGRVGEESFPGVQIPFPPRCDDADVGIQRVSAELETHLVIALAGCAMGDGVGAGLFGNFHQALGDQRSRDGRAEQILALVDGIGAKHRKDKVARELLFQVLDVDRGCAHRLGFAPRGLELLALSEVSGEGDDLATVGVLEPLEDNGCVEASGVGQDDFSNVHCRASLAIAGATRWPENWQ